MDNKKEEISLLLGLEQRDNLKNILADQPTLKLGQTWYLLSKKWEKTCVQFLNGITQTPPGPIDNTDLFDEAGVKPFLLKDYHFLLKESKAWKQLTDTFGIIDPSHEIPRQVVEEDGKIFVDTNWMRLNIKHGTATTVTVLSISKYASLAELITKAKSTYEITADTPCFLRNARNPVLVWNSSDGMITNLFKPGETIVVDTNTKVKESSNCNNMSPYSTGNSIAISSDNKMSTPSIPVNIESPERSLIPLERTSNDSTVEIRNKNTKPHIKNASIVNNNLSYQNTRIYQPNVRGLEPQRNGRTGLSNLGNTCYMNAALQCLSHSKELTQFFLDNKHLEDLNESNPIGCGGKLALTYSSLLTKLWLGTASVVIPKELKHTIGKFAPQFHGYEQHDSQELLSFLLDGLHEDLNRVRKKPYVEIEEAEGDDEYAASKAWSCHKLRNDSIIVDLFHAQLKSTLTCPDCSKVSVTFDPFVYLQVPIPEIATKTLHVTVLFKNPCQQPCKYQIKVPKTSGTIAVLKTSLEDLTGIPANQLIIADIGFNKIWRVFSPYEKTSSIRYSNEIYAYELNSPSDENVAAVPVYFTTNNGQYLRLPAFFSLLKDSTANDLHTTINGFLRNFLSTSTQATKSNHQLHAYTKSDHVDDQGLGSNGYSSDHEDSYDEDLESVYHNYVLKEGDSTTDRDAYPYFSLAVQERYSYVKRTLNNKESKVTFSNPSGMYFDVVVVTINEPDMFDFSILASAENKSFSQDQEAPSKESVNLYACLDMFTQKERLTSDNMWICPVCKQPKEADKHIQIWSSPKVLVIQLKRFSYDDFFRHKIDTFIDFPLVGLDLAPFVLNPAQQESCLFDLFAVSNHSGGLGGGHYTAYCLESEGKWFEFDDSYVGPISSDDVVTSASYLLFYRRRESTEHHAVSGEPVAARSPQHSSIFRDHLPQNNQPGAHQKRMRIADENIDKIANSDVNENDSNTSLMEMN